MEGDVVRISKCFVFSVLVHPTNSHNEDSSAQTGRLLHNSRKHFTKEYYHFTL